MLENQPKVSVIIPVYNVEKYLNECLDSVLAQSFKDFEIICINDGSTDNSLNILESYANKDKRFRIISQSNQGLSKARNVGIDNALGEYIYFLDSDDYIEENLLKITLEELENKNLELVFFQTLAFAEPEINQSEVDAKNKYYAISGEYNQIYLGKDFFLLSLKNRDYSSAVWKQVVRKDFLIKYKLTFYDKLIHEDELYTPQILILAQRVGFIPKILHHRRLRQNSIMTSPLKFSSVYGYFICVKNLSSFISKISGITKQENEILLNFLISPLLNATRWQYTILDEQERQNFNNLNLEEKFLFKSLIVDFCDIKYKNDLLKNQILEFEKKIKSSLEELLKQI